MSPRPLKLSSLLLCAAACLLLAACGSSKTPVHDENNTGANGVNSTAMTLGPLEYQVAISRSLNPYDSEDISYLAGLPAARLAPPTGHFWLGVFLLVTNPSHHTATPSSQISLSDTQGNIYRPIPLPNGNFFAYRPQPIPPAGQIPPVDSVASFGPTEASLLLFQIPVSAYDNRPLVMTIVDPADPAETGKVTLDL